MSACVALTFLEPLDVPETRGWLEAMSILIKRCPGIYITYIDAQLCPVGILDSGVIILDPFLMHKLGYESLSAHTPNRIQAEKL